MPGRVSSRREIVDVSRRDDECFDVVDGNVLETPRHTASRRRPRGRIHHVEVIGGDARLGLAGIEMTPAAASADCTAVTNLDLLPPPRTPWTVSVVLGLLKICV